MYTVQDLERARSELQHCIDRFDGALAKYREQLSTEVRDASRRILEIEDDLRSQGLLEPAPEQILHAALNKSFPHVQHLQLVQYQGKRYRARFFPEQKCRSGWAVKKWGKYWESVKD